MKKTKNILGLDILKVLSASLIVFHHYQQVFKVQFEGINFYEGAFNFGYLVELFFMISGFLTLYSAKAGGILRELMHKLQRIFPMAMLACVFTLLVKSVRSENLSALWNVKTLMANFLLIFSGWPYFSMIGINNPTWYLCILVQCYLMYYFLRWIKEKLQVCWVIVTAVLVVLVFLGKNTGVMQSSTFRGMEAFFIGVSLCEIKDKISKKMWVAGCACLISLALLILLPSQQRRIVVLIVFPVLILLSAWWDCAENQAVHRTANQLSRISFEVYIWHYPLMALEQMIARVWGFEVKRTYFSMLSFTLLIWLLAWPLYKYVERPINEMIRKRIP